MSSRIPPSLAWLVKRRRAVAGLIEKAEKNRATLVAELEKRQQKALQQMDLEIQALHMNLSALDQTIQQHEILIDTEKLGATRIQTVPRHTGHGAMTRAIHTALAQACPKALSTDAIAAFVCTYCELQLSPEEFRQLRYSVRVRLKALVAEGEVARLHPSQGGISGLWCHTSIAPKLRKLVEQGREENLKNPLTKVPQLGFREIMARHLGR